jgi:hypothetical protein
MSRRTKLIILVVFLALLGIPVAYVALTWSPNNLLRFVLVEPPTTIIDPDGNSRRLLKIRVENTGTLPIPVDSASVCSACWGNMPTGVYSGIDLGFEYIGRASQPVTIRPGGAVQGETQLLELDLGDTPEDRAATMRSLHIHYHWASNTKRKIAKLVGAAKDLLPDGLRHYLPYPEWNLDRAPLHTAFEP